MSLGGFLVSRMQPLGEFLHLASELHYVFGDFFQVFESCPGFVSHRADAEAGKQRFLGILPGRLLIQAGKDAVAGGANEELAPGYFIFYLPQLPQAGTAGPALLTSQTRYVGDGHILALHLR